MTQNAKKLIRNGSLGALFLVILIFGVYRSKDLMLGVKIRDVNIKNGYVFYDEVVEVSGVTKKASRILINGRDIKMDTNGNWSEKVGLLDGQNKIKIEAEDKFGNKDIETYTIVKKENVNLAQVENDLESEINEMTEENGTNTEKENTENLLGSEILGIETTSMGIETENATGNLSLENASSDLELANENTTEETERKSLEIKIEQNLNYQNNNEPVPAQNANQNAYGPNI